MVPKPQALVLDTNVLLDLWLFVDPRLDAARERLARGSWCCAATEPMTRELAHIRQRPFPARYQPLPALEAPPFWLCEPPGRPAPWRCRDPSDQMFLDLAWQLGAPLWTRDRDLLVLRKRASRDGMVIETPEAGLHRLGAGAPGQE